MHLSVCGVTTRTRKFEEIVRETDGLLTHRHRSRGAETGMEKPR